MLQLSGRQLQGFAVLRRCHGRKKGRLLAGSEGRAASYLLLVDTRGF
jgi:hypothetical protein